MNASKFFIAIREDNKSVKVMKSSFERELGFVLKENNIKWKVCMLFENAAYAGHYLYLYEKNVFNTFDFNSSNGKK